MQKVAIFILFLVALVHNSNAESQKIRIVATTTFLADMAKNIAGIRGDVVSLMPLGGDPHIYEPVPEDADKISKADIIFKNGLTLEGWLNEMIEYSGTKGVIITVSDGIKPIGSEIHKEATDPHAWMSIKNALIYIANMKDALSAADPKFAGYYESNYIQYKNELESLDVYIRQQVAKIPEEYRVIVTSHDAFRYFGNDYGMRVESVLGTSTESEVRFEDIKHLTEVLDKSKIPAIFVESTINPKLMMQIAGDRKLKIGGKLFADSLGDTESGADTYINMLRHNIGVLTEGLTNHAVVATPQKNDRQFIYIISGLFALAFGFVVVRLNKKGSEISNWANYSIDIQNLSVSYDKKPIFKDTSLTVSSGYVYGIIGGNGSGKSTLIKSIVGLIRPDQGKITINGQPIENIRKYVAYIPQKEDIDWTFPATVQDVVMMGRYPFRKVFEKFSREDYQKVNEALEQMGIGDLKNRQIGTLSGGQQQRVFIARALCQEAEVYLLDEPFVGVDVVSEEKIMNILKDLTLKGKMVLIIHHDLGKVANYFERVIMINQGVIANGPTKEVFTKENIQKTYGGNLVFGDLYV
ncbi:MAG: zinc ABC transporter substrate-binding protein [Bacteroidia bacterium]|nr:zinc ABC transporter substrate-binding protein [Bacteroidia bacterium]